MKKKFLINLLIIVLILMPISAYAEEDSDSDYVANVTFKYVREDQKELDNIPATGCKAVYVAEPTTGKIIYEKNAHEVMYPASTTKILTALLVMENCKMTDTAVVSKNAIEIVPAGYSNANLQVGESLSIKDLLYALLVPSANEAANVLAEHVSGSVEAFADLCNNRAKELGCENLHFVNPNGIHDDNHVCTAYDLYLIAKECQKYDMFNEIVKTKTYTLPMTDIYPSKRTLKTTNDLLLSGTYYYANCTGIKTGTTTPAGQCLVASSTYNGLNLISVVLGGGTNAKGLAERFYDTKQMFEYTYDNYSIKEIANYGDTVAEIKVGKATKDTAELNAIVDSDIATIVPNSIDKDNMQEKITMNENIIAPIKQNQVLGSITYYADGLEYTTNIIASHSVDKLPYARYNIIVVISLVITFIIFVTILKIFKKHRKLVLLFELFIIIGACTMTIPFIRKNMENAITKITPTQSVVIANESET